MTYSDKARLYKSVVILIAFVFVIDYIINSVLTRFLNQWWLTNEWWITIIVRIIEIVILLVSKKRIIEYCLNIIDKILSYKRQDNAKGLIGWWTINISFDENGVEQYRSGSFEIKKTVIGLSIIGSSLYRTVDNGHGNDEKSMESWISNSLVISCSGALTTLIYTYQTNDIVKDGNTKQNISKHGWVVVNSNSKDNDIFDGLFSDLLETKLQHDKQSSRNGKVRITKAKK